MSSDGNIKQSGCHDYKFKRRKNYRKVRISIEMKAKIIKKLNEGIKVSQIAEMTNLKQDTIRKIRRREALVKRSASNVPVCMGKHVSYCRNSCIEKTENLLQAWIKDQSSEGILLDFRTIQQKALSLYEIVKSESGSNAPNFKASTGWFQGFKRKCQLRTLKFHEESESASSENNSKFEDKLVATVTKNKYSPKQVSNGDKPWFYWRILLKRSHTTEDNKKISDGIKVEKSPEAGCSQDDELDSMLEEIAVFEEPMIYQNVETPKESKIDVAMTVFGEAHCKNDFSEKSTTDNFTPGSGSTDVASSNIDTKKEVPDSNIEFLAIKEEPIDWGPQTQTSTKLSDEETNCNDNNSDDSKLNLGESSGTAEPNTTTPTTTAPAKRAERKTLSASENVLRLIGERLSTTREKDNHDIFAKLVACKLRKMSKPMALLAEKLMSHVAYEGINGKLKPTTRIVTPSDNVATSQLLLPATPPVLQLVPNSCLFTAPVSSVTAPPTSFPHD